MSRHRRTETVAIDLTPAEQDVLASATSTTGASPKALARIGARLHGGLPKTA